MAADAAKLLKRLEQLKSQRAIVEDVWRDCYRYTYPLRGVGLEDKSTDGTTLAATAADLQANLYDSTGTDSTRIHASALMSGLTPANSRWFQIDVDGVDDAGRQWLDAAADAIWENIHQSNYDAAAFDCMVDITVTGQFALFCDEADQGGYQFEQWPLATTYFAASEPGGMVDTVLNEFPMTAEQAVRAYGENMVSEKVLKASKDKPDEKFVFVRAIYPREGKNGRMARNMPVASCHFERESKKVVRESGYHEMPIGVPRWSPIPGTAYAFGPVFDALPDLKTLNKVVEFVLKNADLAIAGMWIAEDDGVLNAKSIKIGPRKVIVANSVESMKPLQPAGKFDVAALEIDRLQRSVRKVLMSDQLTPQAEGPAMTATEISVRVELIRQQLGPVYGRMQAEFLQWLVTRCFGLAYRAGALGMAPRSLQGANFSVKYISPISRAQKAVDVAAMDRFENALALEAEATGNAGLLDNYNWDEAARLRAELLGVPMKLIPDRDDVQAAREGRQKQQEQMQMGDMLANVVRDSAGQLIGLAAGKGA